MIVGRSSDDVERVKAHIDDHVAAELTSDPVTIMSTISGDPFFPVLVRVDRGDRRLLPCAGVGTFEIIDTTKRQRTVRHVGDYLGCPPTGDTHGAHSVVLFPTDQDGIVGELEWTRVEFSRIFRGLPEQRPSATASQLVWPVGRLDAARLHDRVIEAWASADVDELTALLGDAPWASRHVHRSASLPPLVAREAGGDLADASAIFSAVDVRERPRRLQRYATHWFSFLELRLDVSHEGTGHPVRLVSLLALEQGRPSGHLAYSVDVVDR